jgi:hypothetical protein
MYTCQELVERRVASAWTGCWSSARRTCDKFRTGPPLRPDMIFGRHKVDHCGNAMAARVADAPCRSASTLLRSGPADGIQGSGWRAASDPQAEELSELPQLAPRLLLRTNGISRRCPWPKKRRFRRWADRRTACLRVLRLRPSQKFPEPDLPHEDRTAWLGM